MLVTLKGIRSVYNKLKEAGDVSATFEEFVQITTDAANEINKFESPYVDIKGKLDFSNMLDN